MFYTGRDCAACQPLLYPRCQRLVSRSHLLHITRLLSRIFSPPADWSAFGRPRYLTKACRERTFGTLAISYCENQVKFGEATSQGNPTCAGIGRNIYATFQDNFAAIDKDN